MGSSYGSLVPIATNHDTTPEENPVQMDPVSSLHISITVPSGKILYTKILNDFTVTNMRKGKSYRLRLSLLMIVNEV